MLTHSQANTVPYRKLDCQYIVGYLLVFASHPITNSFTLITLWTQSDKEGKYSAYILVIQLKILRSSQKSQSKDFLSCLFMHTSPNPYFLRLRNEDIYFCLSKFCIVLVWDTQMKVTFEPTTKDFLGLSFKFFYFF